MVNDEGSSFPSRIHRAPGTSAIGIIVFTLLRVLDPFLQYAIITRHVGIRFIPNTLGGTLAPISNRSNILQLPPYQLFILGMSIGSTIKQVFWAIFVSQQELPVRHAVAIAAFNTLFNTLSTTLSLWSITAAAKPTNDSI